jgi:hypothetical protein
MLAPPSTAMWIEGRKRLSRGSFDWHTAQAHPIIGTPDEVPEPRNVIRAGSLVRAG